MTRKPLIGYVVLPILGFAAYFICLKWLPGFTKAFLHTEHGAIEWGTALSFLLASCIACRLFARTAGAVPMPYRMLYGLFAAAGLFTALEEVSYGQKAFNWQSPQWFAQHNSKGEINLHNMFDNKPSNRLRAIATVGCPICCIVLPLWARSRPGQYPPGQWPHYLLPGTELITLAALTLVLTVFNKIPSIKGMATWSGHLGELKELFWGIVATLHARIISQRLLSPRAANARDDRPTQERSSHHTNRQAA